MWRIRVKWADGLLMGECVDEGPRLGHDNVTAGFRSGHHQHSHGQPAFRKPSGTQSEFKALARAQCLESQSQLQSSRSFVVTTPLAPLSSGDRSEQCRFAFASLREQPPLHPALHVDMYVPRDRAGFTPGAHGGGAWKQCCARLNLQLRSTSLSIWRL
ncbi:hypothetical protein CMUS01_09833 [Colletotrichum musicola]|uniref:Uncharacterized protein n=1 Tax=Colletotrichum musicola TaxID=2175873 RepID=A0A8H6NAE3_9PEZI|nr:hypothetical protein CMUS01_09833 [Colletotrichum musicola]